MTDRFTVAPTSIRGVSVIERMRLSDARGYFERLFCASELGSAGWMLPVAQINRSFTAREGQCGPPLSVAAALRGKATCTRENL